MFQKLAKTLCVVAALGAAGAAAPTSASARDFGATISIGNGGIELVRHRGHYRPNYGCSPRRALNKARHFGIRHARIRGVSRRAIVVAGRKRHHRAVVRFARVPGCPVIAYR
ncbi:hypothetical protein [Jiella mangrovi]|uniref:Antifreeze protein n=1 Tax=Jiella mangrovi TaxID=2821407 RepID=A0ABS4BN11_9HYPH|nr:hypothetical protein [Jiella mangrovi]MBP0617540.1 hypothetical protein [Jiella mangrovi]